MGIDKISGRGPGEAKLYRKKFLTNNLTPTRGKLSVRFSYILLFSTLSSQEKIAFYLVMIEARLKISFLLQGKDRSSAGTASNPNRVFGTELTKLLADTGDEGKGSRNKSYFLEVGPLRGGGE